MNDITAMRAIEAAIDELKHLGGRTPIVDNAVEGLDWLADLLCALRNDPQGGGGEQED